jgi:hypothetical protein
MIEFFELRDVIQELEIEISMSERATTVEPQYQHHVDLREKALLGTLIQDGLYLHYLATSLCRRCLAA